MSRFRNSRGMLWDTQSGNRFRAGTPLYDKILERFPEAAAAMDPQSSKRMAGEKEILKKIDILLHDIRSTEDDSNRLENLVQEARVYLPKRRQQLAQLSPEYEAAIIANRSKVRAAMNAEQMLADLGQLQGGVPMPIIRGTERTHTNYADNPVTGQTQVVPYMDPSDRRVVLRTGYGPEHRYAGDHQSEQSMMNALKLMGNDTQWNDTGVSGNYGLADLAATKEGSTKKVDVMVRKTSDKSVPVPAYTSLVPILKNGREERGRKGSGAADYVKKEVEDRMSRDSVGPISAVESLVADKIIGPYNADRRVGKLLRADANMVSSPERQYDSLIMPGYSDKTMSIRGNNSPQRTPTAPTSIHMMDLGVALDALDRGKISGAVKYNTNYGHDGSQYERLQIKPYFDVKPEMGVIDITRTHPLTQQLLDESVLRTRLI